MSGSDGDIVKDFLVESYENLDRLDRDLVGLEKTRTIGTRWLECFVPFTPSKAPAAFSVSPNWKRLRTLERTC